MTNTEHKRARQFFKWSGPVAVFSMSIVSLIFGLFTIPGLASQQETNVLSAALNFGPSATPNLLFLMLVKILSYVFGESVASVRIVSIIFAVLTLFFFYSSIQRMYHSRVAYWVIILLVSSPLFLVAARDGGIDITYAFWPIALLYLAQKVLLHRTEWLWYTLAGVGFGLSLYTPGMVFLTVPMIFVAIYISHRNGWPLSQNGTTIGLVAFCVSLAPLVAGVINKAEIISQVTLLSQISLSPNVVFGNLGNFLLSTMWEYQGSIRYWIPGVALISVAELVLAALGLGMFIQNLPSIRSLALLWHIISVAFLIGFLNLPANQYVLITPFFYTLVAAGVNLLWRRWYVVFPKNPAARVAGNIILVVLILLVFNFHLDLYFNGWAKLPEVKSLFQI